MVSAAPSDNVRRMISRKTSSLFASLLVVMQLLVSPFAARVTHRGRRLWSDRTGDSCNRGWDDGLR